MTTKNTLQAQRHSIQPISVAINNLLGPAKTQHKPRNKTTYIPSPLPAEGFTRLPSVIAVLGISKTSFLDGVKAGKYPPGKLLSPRCRVWEVSTIRALLASIGQGEAA